MKVAPLLAGLVLIPACGRDDDVELETIPAEELPVVPPTGTDTMGGAGLDVTAMKMVQFERGPAGGDVTGTLRMTASPGQGMQLNVDLMGLTPGEHAWHIHSVPCGREGPVVVAITATPEQQGIGQPLMAGADGHAMGSVTVTPNKLSVEQLQTGQYSLHVHERGGTDHGATAACANLTAGGPSSGTPPAGVQPPDTQTRGGQPPGGSPSGNRPPGTQLPGSP
jgi:Cu/Zn superoxide dismutase